MVDIVDIVVQTHPMYQARRTFEKQKAEENGQREMTETQAPETRVDCLGCPLVNSCCLVLTGTSVSSRLQDTAAAGGEDLFAAPAPLQASSL